MAASERPFGTKGDFGGRTDNGFKGVRYADKKVSTYSLHADKKIVLIFYWHIVQHINVLYKKTNYQLQFGQKPFSWKKIIGKFFVGEDKDLQDIDLLESSAPLRGASF